MVTHYMRHSGNFVNLGNLYSIKPWAFEYVSAKPPNFVNLGRLYAPIRLTVKAPLGFAYFEDGSIFIACRRYMDHDLFAAHMRIAAHFVSSPSPKLQAIRQEDPRRNRLIIVNHKFRNPLTHFLARDARDGERLFLIDRPLEHITLTLDDSGSYPVSTQCTPGAQLADRLRQAARQALTNFRGTLVNGILQPNVRLGNGLRIIGNLEPQLGSKKDQVVVQEVPTNTSKTSSTKSSPPTPPTQDENTVRLKAELDLKSTQLEAKEQELKHREEVLRLKYKTWLLEQRLARQYNGSSSRQHARFERDIDIDDVEHAPEEPQDALTNHSSVSEPQLDHTDDTFPDFNLHDPAPPEALKALRSRIALPKRRILRSR